MLYTYVCNQLPTNQLSTELDRSIAERDSVHINLHISGGSIG
jgi:hypothetical protein